MKVVGNQTSGVAAADHKSTVVMASTRSFEPPAFVSETKSYDEYKSDLYMWSRITPIPKKNQAEVVVYNLEGDRFRIKEKVVLNIGDKIKDSEDGIEELVKFLDTIYKKDEMADAWAKRAFNELRGQITHQSMILLLSSRKNICLPKQLGVSIQIH